MPDDAQPLNPAISPATPEASQETPVPLETPSPTPAEPEASTAQTREFEPLTPESEPLKAQNAPVNQPNPPQPTHTASGMRDLFVKARTLFQTRTTKRLEKIIETLAKKGNISNDDVEKLLRVSDATATRYLSILEKEGRIVQTGKTGRFVIYTKAQ